MDHPKKLVLPTGPPKNFVFLCNHKSGFSFFFQCHFCQFWVKLLLTWMDLGWGMTSWGEFLCSNKKILLLLYLFFFIEESTKRWSSAAHGKEKRCDQTGSWSCPALPLVSFNQTSYPPGSLDHLPVLLSIGPSLLISFFSMDHGAHLIRHQLHAWECRCVRSWRVGPKCFDQKKKDNMRPPSSKYIGHVKRT